MCDLKLKVKVDLVLGGKVCNPSMVKLESSAEDPVAPGTIRGFYLVSWVGAGSKAVSVSPVSPDGTASVHLRMRDGDPDTVKFAVSFSLACPTSNRCCHLCSGFERTSKVLSMAAEGKSAGSFHSGLPCFAMRDNFTANRAVLTFADEGSDAGVAGLRTVPSSLHRLAESNRAVDCLQSEILNDLGSCAVTALNAGTNFLDSSTSCHLYNHRTHYALLDYLFRSMNSPVPLGALMYDSFQAVHSTGLQLKTLLSMPRHELALRFGIPLITRHTACALSNVYCTDYTLNGLGQTCKLAGTEDIAKTFAASGMAIQWGLDAAAHPKPGERCDRLSLDAALDELASSGATRARYGEPMGRMSLPCICDDCENLALGILMKAKAIRGVYAALGSSPAGKRASKLADDMRARAKGDPLFAACEPGHFDDMARVLCTLGEMLESGEWNNSFIAASAKSNAYSLDSPDMGAELSGHGAVIARVRDPGTREFIHVPVEGTTYASVNRPMPRGYPKELPIALVSGQGDSQKVVESMGLATLGTALGQNIEVAVGSSPHRCIKAHFEHSYPNPYNGPFYFSVFFAGTPEENAKPLGSQALGQKAQRKSIGCMPVDTKPPDCFESHGQPVFGGAVLGLSMPSAMAIPITTETFARGGVENPDDLLEVMAKQVEEAWGPGAGEAQWTKMMSHWQPVSNPDAAALTLKDYDRHIGVENTWAFDKARNAALAVRAYSGLAERFNSLQAEDPDSDGARATAFGQYLSATLKVSLPVPQEGKAGNFRLSTMRNLKLAADQIGLGRITGCQQRAKAIKARSKISSEHLFYMCSKGEGVVHSFNKRIA